MKDYKTVKMWGSKTGSMKYYIDAQVKKAQATNAPANATYQKEDGSWSTVDEILNITERPDMADFLPYRSAN